MAENQAQDLSYANTASPLLTLSGEVRNQIWRVCLQDSTAIVIASNGQTQPVLPAAHVSTQLRREIRTLWPFEQDNAGAYERVRADILDLHFSPLFEVLQKAETAHNISLYLNTLEIRLVFSPTTCAALHACVLADREMDICSYLKKKLRLDLNGADFEVLTSTVGMGKMSEPMLLSLRRVGTVKDFSANDEDLGDRYGLAESTKAGDRVRQLRSLMAGLKWQAIRAGRTSESDAGEKCAAYLGPSAEAPISGYPD